MVELVMRIEEEFALSIDDEEAAQICTAGQLRDCIMRKLDLQPATRCLSSATFYQLRRALVPLSGKSRREIRPTTPLSQILPRRGRRESWQQLKQSSHLNLPDLELPPSLTSLIVLGFGLLWVTAFGFSLNSSSLWAWGFFLGGIAYLRSMIEVTRPLATAIPSRCQTVGKATKTVMFSRSDGAAPLGVRPEELWQKLQAIIADELDIPLEKITPDADFVRDLGAG